MSMRCRFRRAVGFCWLAVWTAWLVTLLHVEASLGGLVDETLRWWTRFVLLAGPVVGGYAGIHARELAGWGGGRSHASLLRWFWFPPAAATATLALAWTLAGRADLVRALIGGFTAYWAGFDAAIAAWPLAAGRPYRFLREIPPEPYAADDVDPG